MPRRSTRITLVNNTSLTLQLIGTSPCHGDWTDVWEPPQKILPKTGAPGLLINSWESESAGIATGTEGWVKYLTNDNQLVYIHWDRSYALAPDDLATG